MTAPEVFKPLSHFPSYLFGNQGNIYSKRAGRVLKPVTTPNGYKILVLCEQGSKFPVSVHRLVCEAFNGPCPDGWVTNHKNLLRADNRPENLEWVSQSRNVQHAYDMGARVIDAAHKQRCSDLGKAKRITSAEDENGIVSKYRGKRGDIERIAVETGFSRYVVARVLKGVR